MGYVVEVDLRYPDNIKENIKNFPFCPENKVISKDKYNDSMNKIKLKYYTKAKKLNRLGNINKIVEMIFHLLSKRQMNHILIGKIIFTKIQ